jgi:hypothetical protein
MTGAAIAASLWSEDFILCRSASQVFCAIFSEITSSDSVGEDLFLEKYFRWLGFELALWVYAPVLRIRFRSAVFGYNLC